MLHTDVPGALWLGISLVPLRGTKIPKCQAVQWDMQQVRHPALPAACVRFRSAPTAPQAELLLVLVWKRAASLSCSGLGRWALTSRSTVFRSCCSTLASTPTSPTTLPAPIYMEFKSGASSSSPGREEAMRLLGTFFKKEILLLQLKWELKTCMGNWKTVQFY